jgi:hypothetical protein
MTDKRSSMAKPGKSKNEVSFKEWLEHPDRYVKRGEIVQVVDKLIRLNALKQKRDAWWRRLWPS